MVPLSEARARLSHLVSEVEQGRGSVAIARRSQVKAVLSAPRGLPRLTCDCLNLVEVIRE